MTTTPQPPHVELLIGYANSIDLELATDDLTTPAELATWLVEHGLLARPAPATQDDLALARQLREALQAAFTANHDGTGDFSALDAVAARLPLRLGGLDVPGDGPQPGLARCWTASRARSPGCSSPSTRPWSTAPGGG